MYTCILQSDHDPDLKSDRVSGYSVLFYIVRMTNSFFAIKHKYMMYFYHDMSCITVLFRIHCNGCGNYYEKVSRIILKKFNIVWLAIMTNFCNYDSVYVPVTKQTIFVWNIGAFIFFMSKIFSSYWHSNASVAHTYLAASIHYLELWTSSSMYLRTFKPSKVAPFLTGQVKKKSRIVMSFHADAESFF